MRRAALALALAGILACDAAAQQGTLCAGEAPAGVPLGEVSWARAVYLEAPGREHLVAVEALASDGRATLLELGLGPDSTEPKASRIEGVPCLVLPVPGAVRRPRALWVYPSADPRAAGAGVAEPDGVHVAGVDGPLVVSPELAELQVGTWALDPTGPVSADFSAVYAAACLEVP